jgi:hypothetical protein
MLTPQREIEQYYIKLGVLFPTYHLMYWLGLQVGGVDMLCCQQQLLDTRRAADTTADKLVQLKPQPHAVRSCTPLCSSLAHDSILQPDKQQAHHAGLHEQAHV